MFVFVFVLLLALPRPGDRLCRPAGPLTGRGTSTQQYSPSGNKFSTYKQQRACLPLILRQTSPLKEPTGPTDILYKKISTNSELTYTTDYVAEILQGFNSMEKTRRLPCCTYCKERVKKSRRPMWQAL